MTSDKNGEKISIKDVTYTISSMYLFELVTIRLLTINNFVALGKLFMDVPLKTCFCSCDFPSDT